MTVAVSVNTSDAVILGVDSAVSVPAPGGISRVYEDAEKLFQIGKRPIGVAVYGLGGFENRTIGSYLREFEIDHHVIVDAKNSVADVVEELRQFFWKKYEETVLPDLERQMIAQGKKLSDLSQDRWPALGLVVAGYSNGAYLSEVWNIVVPRDQAPSSARQRRKPGVFGSDWFALYDPIQRYMKGFDQRAINELLGLTEQLRAKPYTDEEKKQLADILAKYEYKIPFGAMPASVGTSYARFLVEFVIGHYHFVTGPQVVGGQARIGVVTYKSDNFQILS